MRWHTAVGALRFASYLTLFAPKPPRDNSIDLQERLNTFPKSNVPSQRPLTVRWNANLIPFIEAETDRDAALGIGLVHAHLRLGQMELLRRISQGRISEMVGEVALDIDRTIRIADMSHAVPEIQKALPSATREWVEAYTEGINHILLREDAPLPHEFALFDLKREPWTVTDVLKIERLIGFDGSWLVWIRLMRVRGMKGWSDLWHKLLSTGAERAPEDSLIGTLEGAALGGILATNNRGGSNALAVSARRAGKAWIASDPHLGLSLPANWVIAGYRSPNYNAVGMMIPGAPLMAVGRNPWIAWGGTSLHAHMSELADVSDVPESEITTRSETIKVRWSHPRKLAVRSCAAGPILSDSIFYRNGGARLALRWIGHKPSDEITAMLNVSRARDWAGFRTALDGFAVPGLNMIYADAEGHVGHAMAARIPRNAQPAPDDLIAHRSANWDDVFTSMTLPAWYEPAQGFVVSANDRPQTDIVIGRFFSSADRVQRISSLIKQAKKIDRDMLARVQQDVESESARELARTFAVAARDGGAKLSSSVERIVKLLEQWDGRYDAESFGAAAFELVLYHFAQAFYSPQTLTAYASSWAMGELIRGDIAAAKVTDIAPKVRQAAARCARTLRGRKWGDLHRLRLQHPLGAFPIGGRHYRYFDLPSAGSSHTVMKAASGLVRGRHGVRFGANARYISDMSDVDANYFCLLGGQDGWFGSTQFADHVSQWRQGTHIQVPLRPESVKEAFPFVTRLVPEPEAEETVPIRASAG